MTVTPARAAHDVRIMLEVLPWPERFERLAVIEKNAVASDRETLAALRAELADLALADLSTGWEGIPLKEAILRLPSKRMRAALGSAAKRLRNRYIVDVMSAGGPPLHDGTKASGPFAAGLDERAIEVPLALKSARLHEPGEVLDAGAALNLPVVREIVGTPAARVTHITLPGVDEPRLRGHEDRFIYASGDLRELPYPSATFSRVVCVSTLEHVGMDNSRYGAAAEHAAASATSAVSELLRVLARGGELLLTVPYGREADHGWFRVLNADSLGALLAPASSERVDLRFFYYDGGWTEGGPVAPSCVLASKFLPDVVTGVAVARVVRKGWAP
jgi:SAM-dependent methyltransferase